MTRPPDYGLLAPSVSPSGIGGWLILPLIGLVFSVLLPLKALIADVLPSFGTELWTNFTSPSSPLYSSYWAPYFVISAVSNVLLAGFASVLLVLFLRRKKELPFLISLFYGVAVLSASFEAVSSTHLMSQLPAFIEPQVVKTANLAALRSLLVLVVWVWYFRVSTRVRNTFIV